MTRCMARQPPTARTGASAERGTPIARMPATPMAPPIATLAGRGRAISCAVRFGRGSRGAAGSDRGRPLNGEVPTAGPSDPWPVIDRDLLPIARRGHEANPDAAAEAGATTCGTDRRAEAVPSVLLVGGRARPPSALPPADHRRPVSYT